MSDAAPPEASATQRGGIQLDTPAHCRAELERVSQAIAELASEYGKKLVRLADVEFAVLYLRAEMLQGVTGANKEEREAKVMTALADDPTTGSVLVEHTELVGETESLKARLKALESRGTHAANANNSLTQESKFQGRVNL